MAWEHGRVRRGLIRCGAAALLFGASTPAASVLAGEMGAFALAGLLYLGAGIGAVPYALRSPPSWGSVRRGWVRLTLAVVFGGVVGPVLLMLGLARTPAASASLLLNLELPLTVLIAGVIFREHLGPRVVVGAVLVTSAGVALTASGGSSAIRWGAVLIALACLAWAVDNVVTAELDELAPAHVTLVKGWVAGTVSFSVAAATGTLPGPGPAGVALVVGALGYGLSITLWVAGARELGAARAQVVFATAPFVGALLAWVALREPATPVQATALLVAATGVALVLRSAHTHEHQHPAVVHDHEHVHDDGHHDHVHPGGDPGRHQHPHTHVPVSHTHPHVPDLHHRHDHS